LANGISDIKYSIIGNKWKEGNTNKNFSANINIALEKYNLSGRCSIAILIPNLD